MMIGFQPCINRSFSPANQFTYYAIKVPIYIGVLNRLKHTLPPRILYTLYNTIILPHFNYGLIFWGHDNARLHKLQTGAIRTFTNSRYNSHTEPNCKLLNIIKLPNLYKLDLYKLYYKIENERVPHSSLLLIIMILDVKLYNNLRLHTHSHNITEYSL